MKLRHKFFEKHFDKLHDCGYNQNENDCFKIIKTELLDNTRIEQIGDGA